METKLIYQKLLLIMRDIGSVGKDSKNVQQGYNFRGIDDVMNELHDKFATHGVLILTEIIDHKREERATKSGGLSIYSINTYRFQFIAEDGSFVNSEQIGEAMDTGDKASNKAASAALKYALLFMFLIPTIDAKDPSGDNSDPRVPKQPVSPAPKQPISSAPKQPAALPNNSQQQANDFDKGQAGKRPPAPVPLTPTLPLWAEVTAWLKSKKKTTLEWSELRKNYIISESDEAELVNQVWGKIN